MSWVGVVPAEWCRTDTDNRMWNNGPTDFVGRRSARTISIQPLVRKGAQDQTWLAVVEPSSVLWRVVPFRLPVLPLSLSHLPPYAYDSRRLYYLPFFYFFQKKTMKGTTDVTRRIPKIQQSVTRPLPAATPSPSPMFDPYRSPSLSPSTSSSSSPTLPSEIKRGSTATSRSAVSTRKSESGSSSSVPRAPRARDASEHKSNAKAAQSKAQSTVRRSNPPSSKLSPSNSPSGKSDRSKAKPAKRKTSQAPAQRSAAAAENEPRGVYPMDPNASYREMCRNPSSVMMQNPRSGSSLVATVVDQNGVWSYTVSPKLPLGKPAALEVAKKRVMQMQAVQEYLNEQKIPVCILSPSAQVEFITGKVLPESQKFSASTKKKVPTAREAYQLALLSDLQTRHQIDQLRQEEEEEEEEEEEDNEDDDMGEKKTTSRRERNTALRHILKPTISTLAAEGVLKIQERVVYGVRMPGHHLIGNASTFMSYITSTEASKGLSDTKKINVQTSHKTVLGLKDIVETILNTGKSARLSSPASSKQSKKNRQLPASSDAANPDHENYLRHPEAAKRICRHVLIALLIRGALGIVRRQVARQVWYNEEKLCIVTCPNILDLIDTDPESASKSAADAEATAKVIQVLDKHILVEKRRRSPQEWFSILTGKHNKINVQAGEKLKSLADPLHPEVLGVLMVLNQLIPVPNQTLSSFNKFIGCLQEQQCADEDAAAMRQCQEQLQSHAVSEGTPAHSLAASSTPERKGVDVSTSASLANSTSLMAPMAHSMSPASPSPTRHLEVCRCATPPFVDSVCGICGRLNHLALHPQQLDKTMSDSTEPTGSTHTPAFDPSASTSSGHSTTEGESSSSGDDEDSDDDE